MITITKDYNERLSLYLHFSEAMCQEFGRLVGDEISGFYQSFACLHEVGRELARINTVLPPTADAVSYPDDVSRIV